MQLAQRVQAQRLKRRAQISQRLLLRLPRIAQGLLVHLALVGDELLGGRPARFGGGLPAGHDGQLVAQFGKLCLALRQLLA